ncbi:hypothetical protein [Bacillus sp. B3-WWTP-C-10-D-3]|uniref:hypothetical protein n=1 Tax=Bacillus sp. B3-WWTP-C-10-D-3 TaxID=2653217 RepID=UPI001869FB95|nr:hypothetical protein [Bacillus sp. B3-WWTP-C-10-D-3]
MVAGKQLLLEELFSDVWDNFRWFEKFIDFFFDEYGQPTKFKRVSDYDPRKFVLHLVAYGPRTYSIMDSIKELH